MYKPAKPNSIGVDNYYVVDLQATAKEPLMLWNVFKSEEEASEAITQAELDIDRYVITKGSRAIRHKLRFFYKSRWQYYVITILKYQYPVNRLPGQKRKTWRTIQRRKKRKLANP